MPHSTSTTSIPPGNCQDDVYAPKFFQGSGRLGRVRFLLYMIAVTLAPALLTLLAIRVWATPGNAGIVILLSFIVMLSGALCIVFTIIISIRRLNDFNAKDWWILTSFIPLIGIVLTLAMLFVPGTPGPNGYGAPPAPDSDTVKILCALGLIIFFIALLTGI
ncbi:DUF805 domain-containing protein [Halomonas sp. ML-15]|uniref:DUF805 domain-containing protein n=1 Tax=Halomonas sp. ML-15 TaxID=2773305 RepID=UPI001746EE5B|nr:DUF805 domain-containing protein [Halomonas sp. ML-15]MBD3895602.1 DUF805 domain-containing protein [Halomonas sp. ML-15]